MKKKQSIKYPIHKMGKYCGYDEHEDGSITIAPKYQVQFDNILFSEEAVKKLLQHLTEQCHQLLIPINKSLDMMWQDLVDDYGLEFDKYIYSYSPHNKKITRSARPRKRREDE